MRDKDYREKHKTKMVYSYVAQEMREKRMKVDEWAMKKMRERKKEENKMVIDQESSLKHRWINLTSARLTHNLLIPNTHQLESLWLIDALNLDIYLKT
jgi:hypothetical protein